jgi:hypothetical protein
LSFETGGYSRPPWQGYPQAKPYLPVSQTPEGLGALNLPASQGVTPTLSGTATLGVVLLTLDALLQLASQQEALGAQRLQPFLKDLLNAPKEWQAFLAQMSHHPELNDLKEPFLPELLNEFSSLHVPLEALQQALEQQLGQASTHLLRLIQGNGLAQVGGNSPVLSELLGTLGQWQQQAHSSPLEALGLYMQLYLQGPNMPPINPALIAWHFLPPNKREEDMGASQSGENTASQQGEAPLVILLETSVLGRLRLQLMQPEPSSLLVWIEHETSLDAAIQSLVQERFVEQQKVSAPARLALLWKPFAGKQAVLPPNADTEPATPERTSSPSDAAFTESANPKLAFYPQQGVSLPVLTAGLLLVRLLVSLDQTQALRQGKQAAL